MNISFPTKTYDTSPPCRLHPQPQRVLPPTACSVMMRCICYNNAVETVDVESVPPSSSDAAQRRERWLRRESSAMIKDFEKRMSGHSIDHFVHEEAIFSMLEPMSRSNELAPCALLDGEWLLKRAEELKQCSSRDERRKLALPRRQDLERDEP